MRDTRRSRVTDSAAAPRDLDGRVARKARSTRAAEPAWHDLATGPTAAPGVQAKLRVGAADDDREREADRVADSLSGAGRGAAPCSACEDEVVQRESTGGSAPASGLPAATRGYVDSIGGRGRPLGAGERAYFEPRLGRDLADVRVHDDAAAARSADAISARAYTHGRDVVFAAGEYRPATGEGRWLLAHELAHVVQQDGASGPIQRAPKTEGDWGPVKAVLQSEKDTTLIPFNLELAQALGRAIERYDEGLSVVESIKDMYDMLGEQYTAAHARHTAVLGSAIESVESTKDMLGLLTSAAVGVALGPMGNALDKAPLILKFAGEVVGELVESGAGMATLSPWDASLKTLRSGGADSPAQSRVNSLESVLALHGQLGAAISALRSINQADLLNARLMLRIVEFSAKPDAELGPVGSGPHYAAITADLAKVKAARGKIPGLSGAIEGTSWEGLRVLLGALIEQVLLGAADPGHVDRQVWRQWVGKLAHDTVHPVGEIVIRELRHNGLLAEMTGPVLEHNLLREDVYAGPWHVLGGRGGTALVHRSAGPPPPEPHHDLGECTPTVTDQSSGHTVLDDSGEPVRVKLFEHLPICEDDPAFKR